MRFVERVAIVTGGGAGIGRATCLAFAREGAAVAVVDLKGADAVAAEIEAAGGRAAAYPADVSRSADVEAMVADVVRRFGSLDILVNNAGIGRPGRIEEVTEEEWDRTLGRRPQGPLPRLPRGRSRTCAARAAATSSTWRRSPGAT